MINVLRDYPDLPPDQALQAAIEAGGWVYAPPPQCGEYRLDLGTLRCKENLRLTLDPRTRIVRTAEIGMLRNRWPDDNLGGYNGRGNITIEGGVWDCRGATGPAVSVFTIVHARDVTLRNMTVLDVPGAHGVDLIGCKNVLIDNVRFAGYRDTGDRGFSEAVQIDGAYGLYSGDCAPADGTWCEDVTVRRCWFGPSGTPGMGAWATGVGSHGYEADVNGKEHRRIHVTGRCAAEGLTNAAVRAWHWTDSSVEHLDATGTGVIIQNSRRMRVERCDVFEAKASGIWVNDTCDDVHLLWNDIVGASASGAGTHYGIRASGGGTDPARKVNNLHVIGNYVRSTANAKPKYGLSLDSTVAYVRRFANDLRWSGASGALQDLSASPVVGAGDLT